MAAAAGRDARDSARLGELGKTADVAEERRHRAATRPALACLPEVAQGSEMMVLRVADCGFP